MILKGDCIEVMKAMKPNSVDAIVTDPPYGLEFMGKDWDKLWDKREFGIDEYSKKSYTCSDGSTRKTNPVSRKLNNPNYKAGIEAQLWHTQWLTEAYRVLKPGGSMLVMGGTRTSHRLACAIEDSGFIIKDTLMWIYGSGFPKAQDLGKMIDKRAGKEREVVGERITGKAGTRAEKRNANLGFESGQMMINETIPSTDLAKHWDGFKVGGIKPAYEPIIWAIKPPEGSYVDNILKWGVGAVNVDECRVACKNHADKKEAENKNRHADFKSGARENKIYGEDNRTRAEQGNYNITKGRFPANVILDEEAGRILDEQSGELKSGARKGQISKPATNVYGKYKGQPLNCESSSGGASRFFYCAKASRGERNAGLEEREKKTLNEYKNPSQGRTAPKCGSPMKNNHPTVKPIKLFEWLIKLITREGQVILDPFIGSGTTAIATHNTARKCVGIEKESEYLDIAKGRIAYWQSRPRQLEMRRV